MRSAYSLLGGGFHGHNGLDVETIVHLYKIYISPVLLYGLELILPTTSSLLLLENFQKKILKQILLLPTCVADITVNILTGILPIEAQPHIRALGLFSNICNQLESSVEKTLARRQLLIKKTNESASWFSAIKHMLRKYDLKEASWFSAIKHMLRKYDLKEASWYLDNPVKKTKWTSIVKKTNANQLHSVTGALSSDASKYDNREEVEIQWAMKAYHHAETYFNLVSSVDPAILKLTKTDNEIYDHFRCEFPDLKIDKIDTDEMKSAEGKEKWRTFCETYKEKVEDYNMGTLLRTDCTQDYSEDNSFLVVRIQFLAIEIARNREGLNSELRYKKTVAKESS